LDYNLRGQNCGGEKMVFIGIGGGTGSGKTSLARRIAEHFEPGQVAVVEQDSYYLDKSDIPLSARREANFDHPNAFDMKLLVSQVRKLKNGEPVEQPVYCYRTHTRTNRTRTIELCPVLVLEGILVLHPPELRGLIDVKVYVDAPDDIRFIRRLQRDMRERGRSIEGVIEQYHDTVRPMHLKFVEPTRDHADVVISGVGDQAAAIQDLIAQIEAASPRDGS
jgi:uridine kinase